MMRNLTFFAALALLSTANASNLRGADNDDKQVRVNANSWWWAAGPRDIARQPAQQAPQPQPQRPRDIARQPEQQPEETSKQAAASWARQDQGGEAEIDMPRKQLFGTGDEQGSHPESPDMPRKDVVAGAVEAKPEHRVLPPLSHGWAYEGGAGAGSNGRKQVQGVTQQDQGGEAEIDMPRKQLQGAQQQQGQDDGEPDMPRKQLFGTGDEQGSHPESPDMPRKDVEAAKPEHRVLPPLSHGWAYEGGAGAGSNGRKQVQGVTQQDQGGEAEIDMPRKQLQGAQQQQGQDDGEPDMPRKQLFGTGDEQGSHPESPDMPRKQLQQEQQQQQQEGGKV